MRTDGNTRTSQQTSRPGWRPSKRRSKDTRTPEQRVAEYVAMIEAVRGKAAADVVRQAIAA